jgi:hypothetical protein
MKANRSAAARRPAPGTLDGEEGVSNVLGAILLFGLFVVTLVTVQVRYVPVWDEDREAKLMGHIEGQLAILKSDMDRQVDNRTDIPITDPLTLGTQPGFRFFHGEHLPGTASFLPAGSSGSPLTVSSPRLTVLQQNGESFLGIVDPTSWVPLDNNQDQYTEVANVRVLRVQIPWPAQTNDCNSPIQAILHVSDASSQELAKAEITCEDSSSERTLHTAIFRREAASDPWEEVSADTEAIFQGADADFFYVDLMAPSLLFDAVLSGLDAPLELSMEKIGLAASYILVYDDTSGGTTGGGGTVPGLVINNYGPAAYPAGSLTVETRNQRYPSQSFLVEHGAILVEQDLAAAMLVPPLLRFSASTTQTVVEWTLPSLTGAGQSLSGADSASVVADPTGSRVDLLAGAARLTFDIPSSHPAAWEDYIQRSLRDLGFVEGTQYTAVSDSDSCLLTLEGTSSNAATDDLLLDFHQASIGLDLRASG